MKELVLNNFKSIEDNKYVGVLTFRDYLNLIKEGYINLNQFIDGYHRAIGLALIYNENEEIKEVEGFQIDLSINKDGENSVSKNGNGIIIQSEKIEILDGAFRTLIISSLDERFMDSLLTVTIHFYTTQEAKNLIASYSTQRIDK